MDREVPGGPVGPSGPVRDAGFDPVVVGPLARAETFDIGAPVHDSPKTATGLAEAQDPPATG